MSLEEVKHDKLKRASEAHDTVHLWRALARVHSRNQWIKREGQLVLRRTSICELWQFTAGHI